MASIQVTKKMREEATCSICLHLMTEPMSISCGHSYCHLCIGSFFENIYQMQPLLGTFSCPQCRAPFKMASLRPNKQLGNLIEAIKEMDQEMSCEEHGETLHLFCEDEGQLICWRCDRGPQHKEHTTALVEDACQGYKVKLQEAVTKLRQLDEECMNLRVFTAKQINEWNEKIEVQKQKIHSDFKNLQRFLQEEEKSYVWKLEKEKEQTLRRLRDNEANLEQKSRELESHILELENKCQGSAQNLLQDVKNTLSRSWAVKLEQPEALSLDLRTVCNVSELYFDVKKMLRSYQVSVTLDPDTAYHELILSEDRRQVTRGCPQENLNPSSRRFSALPCILGCEGFTSGKHYFEVDVGEGTGWDLGVCLENVPRDTVMVQTPQSGFWAIRLCKKKGYVALTFPLTSLQLKEKPLVVGIFLDFEAGVVSFYNMTTGSHIFTFPKASFSDTLRPYFQVYQYSPLFLPPPDV
ncbi:E3 ubiquitin-protein ligase TRIM38 [Hippopotamus amphibius kiboko]|uniref:E3 ubiquitin-protein ligase TRIM38 n=1 Tax=Hippopotamus amphibius kiboko TaxID=575201 RepID=UPI00259280C9|nr:E3 ubiquitin-protein ligase TRIM38 [Hippopotamus amphibius kiboko]XP_057556618.1 E3 ubiquitin-protein ligase TRIM38 [Hippopotamus amphibius kiboko]XP_057556619.1 E3 ubiquitin-protein ligase TRIM38 [Hippopotamus amphibius kiboko]XP_057556620.1 E3 ubiquitin-protein ligase TRIM38 [Hippopotamus amphibius kiboko]XP_057556621.1 E3 ubiquitin-protein ligase TRIM38 [Hippopotamus amphibius kiboko]XP_057556622.1 E3 ubiquitin-protein ligase TRIM38 [Hippopotamus amphibius kiboko]